MKSYSERTRKFCFSFFVLQSFFHFAFCDLIKYCFEFFFRERWPIFFIPSFEQDPRDMPVLGREAAEELSGDLGGCNVTKAFGDATNDLLDLGALLTDWGDLQNALRDRARLDVVEPFLVLTGRHDDEPT